MTAQFFARIDSWWKALGVIAAAVAVGFTIALGVASFIGLPAVVTANADAIEVNARAIAELQNARTLTADAARRNQETIENRLERLECLVVAGRRNTPIEDCL